METILPHTRTSKEVNSTVSTIIEAFNDVIKMANDMGYPIKLYPESEDSLNIYYNDDYPNMILVDKYLSK